MTFEEAEELFPWLIEALEEPISVLDTPFT